MSDFAFVPKLIRWFMHVALILPNNSSVNRSVRDLLTGIVRILPTVGITLETKGGKKRRHIITRVPKRLNGRGAHVHARWNGTRFWKPNQLKFICQYLRAGMIKFTMVFADIIVAVKLHGINSNSFSTAYDETIFAARTSTGINILSLSSFISLPGLTEFHHSLRVSFLCVSACPIEFRTFVHLCAFIHTRQKVIGKLFGAGGGGLNIME